MGREAERVKGMQKRLEPLVWLGIIAVLALNSGCAAPPSEPAGDGRGKTVMGVSLLNLSSEFIVLLNRAMERKAGELGVRLIVNDAQRSAEKQVQQVEGFIAQKVDAIILNPCEQAASSPAVDQARAAGIPIVNVNSETQSAPTAFVGSRDEESARLAMEYVSRRLEGRGSVVMMEGFLGQTAQLKRRTGAMEVFSKQAGLQLLAAQTAEWDRAKAVSLMENWIQSFGPKIQAVFAQNDEMAMGALLALEQTGQKSRVVVVGVDAIADALQAVKDGRLDATVFQDAERQGGTALEIAWKIVRRQAYDSEVYIPFQLVTRENVDSFLRQR